MTALVLMLAVTATVDTGGVAALPLPAGAVDVLYGDEPALIVADHVIVGVGLDAAPGRHHVVVRTAGGDKTIDFEVAAKQYPEQRLTIPDRRKVNPLPEDMQRIARESELQRAAYARRTPVRHDLLPFKQPVQGIYSSPFGLRRFLNDQPRSPHSGLDIAADTGTPVASPAPATVALTGDFFFSGNVVLLDHGGGLVSMYGHRCRGRRRCRPRRHHRHGRRHRPGHGSPPALDDQHPGRPRRSGHTDAGVRSTRRRDVRPTVGAIAFYDEPCRITRRRRLT